MFQFSITIIVIIICYFTSRGIFGQKGWLLIIRNDSRGLSGFYLNEGVSAHLIIIKQGKANAVKMAETENATKSWDLVKKLTVNYYRWWEGVRLHPLIISNKGGSGLQQLHSDHQANFIIYFVKTTSERIIHIVNGTCRMIIDILKRANWWIICIVQKNLLWNKHQPPHILWICSLLPDDPDSW